MTMDFVRSAGAKSSRGRWPGRGEIILPAGGGSTPEGSGFLWRLRRHFGELELRGRAKQGQGSWDGDLRTSASQIPQSLALFRDDVDLSVAEIESDVMIH